MPATSPASGIGISLHISPHPNLTSEGIRALPTQVHTRRRLSPEKRSRGMQVTSEAQPRCTAPETSIRLVIWLVIHPLQRNSDIACSVHTCCALCAAAAPSAPGAAAAPPGTITSTTHGCGQPSAAQVGRSTYRLAPNSERHQGCASVLCAHGPSSTQCLNELTSRRALGPSKLLQQQ